jgi:ferritin-like metal-binding protein YciE
MAKEMNKTLRELFHDTLKDIYFAEKKILGANDESGACSWFEGRVPKA